MRVKIKTEVHSPQHQSPENDNQKTKHRKLDNDSNIAAVHNG
jgi:hypothetical protein